MEKYILSIRIVDYLTFVYEVKQGSQLDYLVYGYGYYQKKNRFNSFFTGTVSFSDINMNYYFDYVPDERIRKLQRLQQQLTPKKYLEEIVIVAPVKKHYPYFYNVPSGKYGNYSPDAMSLGVGFGGSGGFFSASFNFSIVATHQDIAIVIGGSFDFGLELSRPGFAATGNIGFHDNYGQSKDVLQGLGGYDLGWTGQIGILGMSRTRSIFENGVLSSSGVQTTTINYGIGLGGGYTRSKAEVYKLSKGIETVKNWLE
ncbi:hypothetical protein HX004_11950 [Myroides sp. 1354]|uniref:hypothetical protein n=1 Tax=unclassified Myroides TaxID=2642485 RepID=UPI002574D7C0|nr:MULTISPECIES: hypothetical protein [unclassified Myroides]MDM1045483.1 hypothetical protein [Myroides sp. R163-1]MDM1056485.1 hypothetical protein [Myroides sp. 1354]MDM1069645.1 hypothetical protein [Myroides sp. 1372]